MNIMSSVSYLGPHIEEINTLALDDPEIAKYPLLYLIEPGWWQMTDSEAIALRAFIEKGGFVIVDDFKPTGFQGCDCWEHFEANMKRILPEARILDIDASHPIFHSFFEINSFDIIPQAYNAGRPVLPRRLRGQRPPQAAADDHQLQHRHLAVLGMVERGAAVDRADQRSLQAGRELHHLRHDTLTME